jgi:hypothetical protein
MLENTIARNKRRLITLKGISQDLKHSEISARAGLSLILFLGNCMIHYFGARIRNMLFLI